MIEFSIVFGIFVLIAGLVWFLVVQSERRGAESKEKEQTDVENKRLLARLAGQPARSMAAFRRRVRDRRNRGDDPRS